MASYEITRLDSPPASHETWDGPTWSRIQPIELSHFHEKSSAHRPRTQAKLAYTADALHLHYRVEDRYVLAKHTEPQSMVCQDSCVEFFVQPQPDGGGDGGGGYFNFEINCGGTLLLQYHDQPRQGGPVDPAWVQRVKIEHTMPRQVIPERPEPTTWRITATIPLGLLAPNEPAPGETWRAGFYKCADHSSHPHWGSWTPLTDPPDFHRPAQFGTLVFLEP